MNRHTKAVAELSKCLAMDPDNFRDLKARADALMNLHRYAEAERDFRIILRLDPKDEAPHRTRGKVLCQLGKWEDAQKEYKAAISINPNNPENYIFLADALKQLTRWKEMAAALDKATATMPDVDRLATEPRRVYLNCRALVCVQSKKYIDALAFYSKMIVPGEEGVYGYFGRATCRHAMGQLSEAISDLDKAIERNPNLSYVYETKSLYLEELGKNDESIQILKDLIGRNLEDRPNTHFTLAYRYHKLGRIKEGVAELDQVIAGRRIHEDGYRVKAAFLEEMGKTEEAINTLKAGLAICDPQDNQHLLDVQSVLLHKVGRIEEAVAALDKAIISKPEQMHFYIRKAEYLEEIGKTNEAVRSLALGAKASRTDLNHCHYLRATMLHKLGRRNDAISEIEKALHYKHNDATLHYRKAQWLDELGKTTESLRALEVGIKATEPQYHYVLYSESAIRLYNTGRVKEALEALDKAIQSKPDHVHLYTQKAHYLENIGKRDEGIKTLRAALKNCSTEDNLTTTVCALANYLRLAGRRSEALQILTPTIARRPLPQHYALLIRILRDNGEAEQEKKYFQDARQHLSNEDMARLYVDLGHTYVQDKQPDEAVTEYSNSFSFDTNQMNVDELIALYSTYPVTDRQARQLTEGLLKSKQHHRLSPASVRFLTELSIQAGEVNWALRFLNESIKVARTPELVALRAKLNFDYFNNFEEAEKDLTEAIPRLAPDGNLNDWYHLRIKVRLALGLTDGAIQDLSKVLSVATATSAKDLGCRGALLMKQDRNS
ncbi:MAG: tetratricopeptide repeat protein, partial [Candidatus Obscuribacterales bacterium]|nr:tetratricopeptide repeat protein [Candidatus Obscuribacterales bacterium]